MAFMVEISAGSTPSGVVVQKNKDKKTLRFDDLAKNDDPTLEIGRAHV
jgi:hypothetical protein